MSELPGVDTSAGSGSPGPGEPRPPVTPRWVKITGIILGVILLAALAKVVLSGGVGGHGPGLHGGLGSTAAGAPPSSSAAPAAQALPAS